MAIPAAELLRHLHDHRSFLETSAESFDLGRLNEAKRMAVSLRVLFHATRTSHALMDQLIDMGEESLPCVNAEPVPDNALVAMGGMYEIGYIGYHARTDMSGRSAPFKAWWVEPVNRSAGVTVSRRMAVLALSNQGGGAHVDSNASNEYRQIAVERALGIVVLTGNEPDDVMEAAMNDPLPYIVRATTAEALHYLEEFFHRAQAL